MVIFIKKDLYLCLKTGDDLIKKIYDFYNNVQKFLQTWGKNKQAKKSKALNLSVRFSSILNNCLKDL